MEKWERMLVQTDRGQFEVFIKGEGEPLCVSHQYSVFNESGDYFADTFTENHRVYLINLREAGSSAKAEQPYQLSFLETVFDLEAIREALQMDKWFFAGHSTGGMIGLMYGIYYSDALMGLILTGTAARDYFAFSPECIYHPNHPNYQIMQDYNIALMDPSINEEDKYKLSIERTKLSLRRPELYEQYFTKNIKKSMSASRMNYFNREIQVFDLTRKLSLIRVKTLILCGRHDVQCPISYSIEMQDGIPDSNLVIYEESNHYPFLEERELFQDQLKQFVTE